MDVAFISCVKEKRIGKYKAKDLYTSDFFRKSFGYCSSKYKKIYILSAKYGLLDLNDEITNYEMTLNDFSKDEKIKWSNMVYEQMKNKINNDDELYFYVGNNYREYLLPLLKNNCSVPLQGKGIGEQLQYFKNNMETKHEFF
tara:strand:+ start:922 stop:1347 length:426 start_codon:yes stop_codon:yes gene_type:complete